MFDPGAKLRMKGCMCVGLGGVYRRAVPGPLYGSWGVSWSRISDARTKAAFLGAFERPVIDWVSDLSKKEKFSFVGCVVGDCERTAITECPCEIATVPPSPMHGDFLEYVYYTSDDFTKGHTG